MCRCSGHFISLRLGRLHCIRALKADILSRVVIASNCSGHMTSRRREDTTRLFASACDAIRRRISGLSSASGHEFTRRATNRATTPDARTARVNANSTRALFPARRRAFFPFRHRPRSGPPPSPAHFSFSRRECVQGCTNPSPTPIREDRNSAGATTWSNNPKPRAVRLSHVHVRWTIRNSNTDVPPGSRVGNHFLPTKSERGQNEYCSNSRSSIGR